jgi:hypothetical protein
LAICESFTSKNRFDQQTELALFQSGKCMELSKLRQTYKINATMDQLDGLWPQRSLFGRNLGLYFQRGNQSRFAEAFAATRGAMVK